MIDIEFYLRIWRHQNRETIGKVVHPKYCPIRLSLNEQSPMGLVYLFALKYEALANKMIISIHTRRALSLI